MEGGRRATGARESSRPTQSAARPWPSGRGMWWPQITQHAANHRSPSSPTSCVAPPPPPGGGAARALVVCAAGAAGSSAGRSSSVTSSSTALTPASSSRTWARRSPTHSPAGTAPVGG